MREILTAKKAKFRITTFEFIWHFISCRCLCNRNRLRNSVTNRKVLNYRMGNEKINKELDIGVILNKLRQFSYFMKVSLTKNQRNLLKIKSTKFLPSSDDMQGVTSNTHYKIVDEKAMLENYIDSILKENN